MIANIKKSWLILLAGVAILAAVTSGVVLAKMTSTGHTGINLQNGGQPGSASPEMSNVQKLGIGLVLLEDSGHPVNPEQAGQMVILWKALRNLAAGDNMVEVEKTALINQIQGALTAEQQAAIESMQIDLSSMREAAEKLGVQIGPEMGSLTAEQQATRAAAMPSSGFNPGARGGMQGGGPPFEGGMPGMMGEPPSSSETGTVTLLAQGSGLGLPDKLVQALIHFLAVRASSGP